MCVGADKRTLVIIEHPYRGSLETQFADSLYTIREINRQLGGLDLLLRGPGVTCAFALADSTVLQMGERKLDSLPNPRRSLRTIIDEGASVSVEESDLPAFGADSGDLLPGVCCLAPGESAQSWSRYRAVWFM